jgi:hypothetical protein
MPRGKKRGKKGALSNWVAKPRWGAISSQIASEVRRLTLVVTNLTTSAAGFLGIAYGSGTLSSTLEWSSYSARFTEYRLLGIRVNLTDGQITTQTAGGNVVLAADDTGNTTLPTSAAQLWAFAKARCFNLDNVTAKPIRFEVSAKDIQDMDFSPTATPAASIALKGALQGPVSTIMATAYVEFSVEFRSPQ